ncbi:hypothetical protein RND81_06G193200 [Saponaria officinalis]|uniref:BHLH domain-containing protein n=1 Tax=Saponaria officinalis TaxID=3572 RepID=A0AAW1KDH3_SAPOF
MELEWSTFNGVSVNEEADFMAKMFPNSSIRNELEMSSNLSLSSSTIYSGYESKNDMISYESGSYNSTDTNYSNCFSSSQESSLSEKSDGIAYQCNEIYFMSDPDQFLAVDGTSLPVGFCLDAKGCIQEFPGNSTEQNRVLNVDMSCDDSDGLKMDLTKGRNLGLNSKMEMEEIEAVEDDKSLDLLEHARKRCRKSEVQKGKRNVRSKSSNSISSCISQEESNGENSNAKTRCPRGSAVDPQSLYARKRRERINERLRILQNLIPNGTKVDISTMLEEAVQYVKFLELQIKLLSSDDLWMFAPLAYNGLDIGLDSKLRSMLSPET